MVRLGQANASAGLSVGLAVAGVVALLVAVAGGVQAFRSPASTGVLHDRQARRRYGVAVGVEFSLAGVGAAVLAVAGQATGRLVGTCGRSVAALVHRRRHPGGGDCGRCR